MNILQTILSVKAANPEVERAIAADLSAADDGDDLTNDSLQRLSIDYPQDKKKGPKVVEVMGNPGESSPKVEDKGTL